MHGDMHVEGGMGLRPEIVSFTEIPVHASIWCVDKYPYHWHDALEILLVLEGFLRKMLPDSGYLFLYCCSVYHEGKIPDKYMKLKEYILALYTAIR